MITLAFGVLSIGAALMAFATRDWRLKTFASACLALWLTTLLVVSPRLTSLWWLDPLYTSSLLLLLVGIQGRGAVERARGEPLAAWLLIPMGIEAVAALSYLATPQLLSPIGQLQLIQVGFAAELLCIIIVSGRRLQFSPRLREAWRFARSLAGSRGAPA